MEWKQTNHLPPKNFNSYFMSLYTATLLPGIILVVLGVLLLWEKSNFETLAKASLRSLAFTFITMGFGSGWFIFEVSQLGVADFGQYRNYLFILFLGITLLSFVFVKDFLSVRGAVILGLMFAKVLLEAAYMQDPPSRLFMVSFVYLCIIFALYLGVVPYKMRDFLNWLFARRRRVNSFGFFFALYGLLLCGVAFSY